MPAIDDSQNPAASNSKLSLVQTLNTIAFILKKITGQSSWKVPPPLSLVELGAGDTGATGAQGIQGEKGDKGDKGDPGESAPNHQHQITDISGLQTALDSKAAIGHEHQLGLWQDISLASAWSNYASGSAVPRCRKLMGNLIEVRGTIKKASSASANEIVATLPVGYRPTETSYFITWAGNGYCRLQIDSSGIVKVNITGSNGSASLNFIFGLE